MNLSFSSKTRYFLNCDLLNKNLIKNIHKLPCVNKIKISFSTSDVFNQKIYPPKAFLVFYLIFASLSFLKVNETKKILFSEISSLDKKCSLEISINNQKFIDQFTFNFVQTKDLFLKDQKILTLAHFLPLEKKKSLFFFSQKRDPMLKMYTNIDFSIYFNLKNPSKNLALKNIFI